MRANVKLARIKPRVTLLLSWGPCKRRGAHIRVAETCPANWQPVTSPDCSLMSYVLAVIHLARALLTSHWLRNNKLLWKLSTRNTLPTRLTFVVYSAAVSGDCLLSVKQTCSPGLRWTALTSRPGVPHHGSRGEMHWTAGADGDSWLAVRELVHRTNHMPGFPSWQSWTQRHARTPGETALCWHQCILWRHRELGSRMCDL